MSGIVNVEEVDELSDWLVGRGGFKGYTGVAVKQSQEVQAAALIRVDTGGAEIDSDWSAREG